MKERLIQQIEARKYPPWNAAYSLSEQQGMEVWNKALAEAISIIEKYESPKDVNLEELLEKEYPIEKISEWRDEKNQCLREAARKFWNLAMQQQKDEWVSVEDISKLPTDYFIGCEKGSRLVVTVNLHNGKIYRLTDTFYSEPMELSHYMPLPEPPIVNQE